MAKQRKATNSKRKKRTDMLSQSTGGSSKQRQFDDAPYPYPQRMKRKEYEKILRELQIELLKMQRWVTEKGERIIILFEGRDAAGKGGCIKRFTEHLNPRGARVVALPKPNETEKGQWYFQRYIVPLPTAGEIVFFDRSWYNRAGVEPVMGYCTPKQYLEFMRQVPEFERSLVNSGLKLFKLWFAVSQKEQLKRFKARQTDPLKQWKLSPIDLASLDKWDHYTNARDHMFFSTHTSDAPWTIIRSDDKKRARINAIRHVLHALLYTDKNPEMACAPDPNILGSAKALMPGDAQLEFRLTRK